MATEKRSQFERLEGSTPSMNPSIGKIAVLRSRLKDGGDNAARRFGVVKEQIVKIMS